jgi:hypothetical protein
VERYERKGQVACIADKEVRGVRDYTYLSKQKKLSAGRRKAFVLDAGFFAYGGSVVSGVEDAHKTQKLQQGNESSGYIGKGCCVQHLIDAPAFLWRDKPFGDHQLLGPGTGVEFHRQGNQLESDGGGEENDSEQNEICER